MNLGKLTQGRFSAWPENLVNHVGVLTHGRFSCFQIVPVIPPVPPFGYYGGDAWRMKSWKVEWDREVEKDDNELLEMLAIIVPTLY